jgi:anaerobic magnesium-protoporphyrin IX monomethyl ester cyclase
MKTALVRPSTVFSRMEIRPSAVPPLGLAYIAGSLQAASHQVAVVDAVGEGLDLVSAIPEYPKILRLGLFDDDTVSRLPSDCELIGISCMFSTEWPMAHSLITRIRKQFPNAKIVAGGEHITACPEYVLKVCPELDYCALGEGEQTMVDLANTLASGGDVRQVQGLAFRDNGQEVIRNPRRDRMRDLDQIPPPAWDLFPIDKYLDRKAMAGIDLGRSIPMLASRGCPFQCTFCSVPKMWGNIWKARDPALVLAEMRGYMAKYKVTNFDIYDLTMIVKRDWIIQMAQAIIDSGLPITWQLPSGTRSEILDGEVADLLYRSGCRHIIYAPESGSTRMLELIKKKIHKSKMASSVHQAVETGIVTKANFIVGFPDERIRDVFASYGFALQLAFAGLHELSFFPFSPYPGSALFDRLQGENQVSLSDPYFYRLLTNTRSFSAFIPTWSLRFFRLAGILIFFSASFLMRPWRLWKLSKDLWTGKPHTRLAGALLRLARRLPFFRKHQKQSLA